MNWQNMTAHAYSSFKLFRAPFMAAALVAGHWLVPTSAVVVADNNCNKRCGFGELVSNGLRDGCAEVQGACYWETCSLHVDPCGYSDNSNDSCFGWALCNS